jgi:hypothetical protein
LFLSLFCPGSIFAATSQSLSINDTPLTIDQSQEFEIGATFICSNCTSDSYLRSVFYPSGSSYFGFTQDNNGNWNNATGGNCTTYFKITQADFSKEGTWSGKLKVKPDIASPYYGGPGEYLFKVGRYTSSCGSPLWSGEVTVAITGPTPTPTAAPANTPTPTNTPTSISTPTPKVTVTPTAKPTLKPASNAAAATSSSIIKTGDVLSESSKSAEIKNLKVTPQEIKIASDNRNNLLAKLLIFIGIVFLLACGIVFAYPYIVRFKNRNVSE